MSHHELPKMAEPREDQSQSPHPSSNSSEHTRPCPAIPSDFWKEIESSPLTKYLQDLSEEEWLHLSEAMRDPMTKVQFFEVCMSIVKIVSLSSMKLVIPAYIRMLQEAKTKGSSKSPNVAANSSAQDIAKSTLEPLETVIELTGEGVQQCVAENLKSLAANESENADASSSSDKLTCAVVREVMFRMRATLTALGKSVAQGSHRGAERMIHQVTRRITACLTSQKAQQQSGSTPENRSLASDVANTTGEVMAVVIQTMESHLDDQEDQHAKEVLSTMAATVKMMTETDSAALEHPHDLMDISHLKGQSQTQKQVRSSSRHTTQSIDKLSDREFQEKARNAVSDVLIKRFPGSTTQLTRPSSAVIDQSNHCRDENGGTPSVSVADLAASTITELFVEEMMYMVESTENFIEQEPTHGEKNVQGAALEIYQKMKNSVMDIFNMQKLESLEERSTEAAEAPGIDQDVTTSEEDVESCTKEIVSKIVVLYKSVSENEDVNSLDSRTSRESLVKTNFVDNVFAQLENLTHGSEDIQVGSNNELRLDHQKSGTSVKSSSQGATPPEMCLHTLSDKSFQTAAIETVSGILKKSVTTLPIPTEPEISANATNQGSEEAACEIVGSFVQDVGSFAQLIQGSESVEGSGSAPTEAPAHKCSETDNQKTTAASKIYQNVKTGVKKYLITNTLFQNKTKKPIKGEAAPFLDAEGTPLETSSPLHTLNEVDLEAVDSCTKSVIGEIIGVYKSKASEEGTEPTIQDVGEILSELESLSHSTNPPKSVSRGSKNRSSASSIQHLSAALQKLSGENVFNQVIQQVSKVLLKSVQGLTGSESSVHQDGSVGVSEAGSTALDITDTVVKGVESLLHCPESLEMTSQEAGVTEPLVTSHSSTENGKLSNIFSITQGIFQNLQRKVNGFLSKHHASDGKRSQNDTKEALSTVLISTEDRQPGSDDSTKGYGALSGFSLEENLQTLSKDLTDRIKCVLSDSNSDPQVITLIAGKSSSDSALVMKENRHAQKKDAALEMVYVFAEEAIRYMLQPHFRLPSKLTTNEGFPVRPVYSDAIDLFTKVMVHQVMNTVETVVEQGGSVRSDKVPASSRPSSSTFNHEFVLQHLDENTDTTDSSLPLLDSDEYSCLVTMLILRLLSKIKDQQLVSADLIDATRDLIERVLLEFTDVSRSATHPKNAKVHKVYRIVYDYLMKGLGTTTALKAIETQDLSFDQLLIIALTKQLLHTCDTQDPTTQKTPRPEDGASPEPNDCSAICKMFSCCKMKK
ncbi:uncharacterized protein LOC121705020 isoform X2 [Alosa sapidissima]|uniref:uncharacterized protein LOC121705020 isoform X2 n=1 Tax=Alosa sapidissima TaxID=34773 RepID=UPI001C095F8E|nr:uncharacterized protein LOC121705020 isoform X2 [Alosa sapidissima]